jgi:hypothetical protein
MTQSTLKFIKVPKILMEKYGIEIAVFYGYLLDMRMLSENTTFNPDDNRSFMDDDGIYSVLSYEKITNDTGLSERKIRAYKKKLTELGLMKEKRQLTGGNKIYLFDIPVSQ